MGLGRRFVEGAFKKLDEINERDQARAVAKLTPAERERYDMWVGRTEALQAGASVEQLGDPRLIAKVLQGPAGEELHGVVKGPKRPAPIEDPAAWEVQAAAERAVRDELRAPYLAPARQPLRIARVLTQERTQAREVCEYLASSGLAARADLVYGVYRVPDAIDLGKLLGTKVVEWDVVHASEGTLPPAATPASAFFEARKRWVDRAPGEPSPLDEDLGLDVLARAGIGPELTLGIARELTISHRGGDSEESVSEILAAVRGVHVLADASASAAIAAASGGEPWQVAHEPPAGVVVDVLQWDAIAQAIHPVRQRHAPLPSPFPYLPLTPQELLRAYVEIVGVQPADAYSAQVTHDRPFDLMGRTSTKWACAARAAVPTCPAPTASSASAWPGGTTSSSHIGTGRSTRTGEHDSTPTPRTCSRRACGRCWACARRCPSQRGSWRRRSTGSATSSSSSRWNPPAATTRSRPATAGRRAARERRVRWNPSDY